jgi:hypothetical protein
LWLVADLVALSPTVDMRVVVVVVVVVLHLARCS